MTTLKPSRFEAYLALRHPEITQRPGKVHEELLGWIEKRGMHYVMQLQFGFGIVEARCGSNGRAVYEALTALLDDLDEIIAVAKQDMLRSPELDESARASIMIDTVPNHFVIKPECNFYMISIQDDVGYYGMRSADFGESVCVYVVLVNGRMMYDEWGTST